MEKPIKLYIWSACSYVEFAFVLILWYNYYVTKKYAQKEKECYEEDAY